MSENIIYFTHYFPLKLEVEVKEFIPEDTEVIIPKGTKVTSYDGITTYLSDDITITTEKNYKSKIIKKYHLLGTTDETSLDLVNVLYEDFHMHLDVYFHDINLKLKKITFINYDPSELTHKNVEYLNETNELRSTYCFEIFYDVSLYVKVNGFVLDDFSHLNSLMKLNYCKYVNKLNVLHSNFYYDSNLINVECISIDLNGKFANHIWNPLIKYSQINSLKLYGISDRKVNYFNKIRETINKMSNVTKLKLGVDKLHQLTHLDDLYDVFRNNTQLTSLSIILYGTIGKSSIHTQYLSTYIQTNPSLISLSIDIAHVTCDDKMIQAFINHPSLTRYKLKTNNVISNVQTIDTLIRSRLDDDYTHLKFNVNNITEKEWLHFRNKYYNCHILTELLRGTNYLKNHVKNMIKYNKKLSQY